MDVEQIAAELLERAAERGQAVMRCNNSTLTDELRAAIRRLAGQRNIGVRTGLIGDVLAVILADADLWDEPVSVMRDKLPTPATFNTVH